MVDKFDGMEGWGMPGWDQIQQVLDLASSGPSRAKPAFRTPLAPGIGQLAGENLGGELKGNHGGGGLTGGNYYHDVRRVPVASLPSVEVGVYNRDPLANVNVPLAEIKHGKYPTQKDVASSPDYSAPDYSGVYDIDDKIKQEETKGRGLLDGLEQQILGRDTYAERLSGLYRQRSIARDDAESKFAQYVRANQDPNSVDPSTLKVINTPLGEIVHTGLTRNGQPYYKVVGKFDTEPKETKFQTPLEEEGTGFTVVGSKPGGELVYGKKKVGQAELYGPQTKEDINDTEEGDVQRPVGMADIYENAKLKREVDPAKVAATEARAAEAREKASEKAKADEERVRKTAFDEYVKTHDNDVLMKKMTSDELAAAATKYADAEVERFRTGKRPEKTEGDGGSTKAPDFVVKGRDKNGKLIVEPVKK